VAAFLWSAAAYRLALDAVAELPVRVLLTGARDLDLGVVPPNVHVEAWVPQADVLAYASAVICHGGSGTTLGALAAGLPLVVVPLFADQPYNATRIASVGAGVVVSLERIRGGLERVLADDRYRRTTEAIAAEMRSLPPTDEFLRASSLDPA
jgi:MGT family glycosyltransferase